MRNIIHQFLLGLMLIASVMLIPPGQVDAVERLSGWHHGQPFAYEEGLLDYVKFPRTWLADHGVNIHASLLPVYQNIVRGGLDDEDDDKLTTSYDVQTYLNSSKLGLWKGGYGLVRAEGKWGDDGVNSATGAVIPVNNDAAVPNDDDVRFELTEWWYSQAFIDGKLEALAGMWAASRFYDVVPFSSPYYYRFLNSHMFFNSVLFPYAPYNILGGMIIGKPTKWLTITTSISDPNSSSNDVDWFDEGDFDLLHQWQVLARPFGKQGMYSIGIAYRDKEQPAIKQDPTPTTTRTDDHDWAFYANFNQWLYQNPANPHQAIGIFGRFGASDGRVNTIERHYSLGISFDEMIPFRPRDVFGIVGWYNQYSDDLDQPVDDTSQGFEAYYRIQVTPWLQVSPSMQFLIDPGFEEGNDDTLVLGLRTLIHL